MCVDENRVRVLVADDDPFLRDMLAMILQAEDYDVLTAEDGRDALEKQKAGPEPGLIISDMNMPGMTGVDLVKQLRAAGADTPVIILTGGNEKDAAMETLKSGANDYVIKDENLPDTIILSVKKVLEEHAKRTK